MYKTGRRSAQHGESKADTEGAETVVFGGTPPSPLNRNGYRRRLPFPSLSASSLLTASLPLLALASLYRLRFQSILNSMTLIASRCCRGINISSKSVLLRSRWQREVSTFNINNALIKSEENVPLRSLVDHPVTTLQGMGPVHSQGIIHRSHVAL